MIDLNKPRRIVAPGARVITKVYDTRANRVVMATATITGQPRSFLSVTNRINATVPVRFNDSHYNEEGRNQTFMSDIEYTF